MKSGWARLDTESPYLVTKGFSGGGLWSPDYQAVVGLVGQAHANGDGRAFTLYQAVNAMREDELELLTDRGDITTAGPDALASWGWALATDVEARRHWVPRSRGVTIETERGYRFRGRRIVLTEIVTWLEREQLDREVLVVTGSPGVGKSAVLARIVTTADAGIAAALPNIDSALRAPIGSIACAVHAKGKTALEVGHEIARAASAQLSERLDDLVPGIRSALTEQGGGRRFTVVVDALDETVTTADARLIIHQLLVPLVETCSDVGVQVLVGTRRRDADGDLIAQFGLAHSDIDLDLPSYFELEDLVASAEATLQLIGDERPGNPYTDIDTAQPLARRIALVSAPNFLIAGLIARTHGLHDDKSADPAAVSATPTVGSALAGYLARVSDVDGLSAADALLPLAYAYAPGLTLDLWTIAIQAITGRAVTHDALHRFVRGSAANFLVETTTAGTTYRMFHQALNDSLLTQRAERHDPQNDQRALARSYLHHCQEIGWDRAPDYLLSSLPHYAAQAGLVDDLLADANYLLYGDLRSLIPTTGHAHTRQGRNRARLLRLTPRAITATPDERVALFSITEVLDNLGDTYLTHPMVTSYRARWAHSTPRSETVVLEGHPDGVYAISAVPMPNDDGSLLLASAGWDGSVPLWDPGTGYVFRILKGHTDGVRAICALPISGRTTLVATAGRNGAVRLWDALTGALMRSLDVDPEEGRTICALPTTDGGSLLATASLDARSVRLWDPSTGDLIRTLACNSHGVNAMCAVQTPKGRVQLAVAGSDGTVQLWDPATGALISVLGNPPVDITVVCSVRVSGARLRLAAGTSTGAVHLFDLETGRRVRTLSVHPGEVTAVCAVPMSNGEPLLATIGRDGAVVRLWNPDTGALVRTLEGHTGEVTALCALPIPEGPLLLATSGRDGTVRLWDTDTGSPIQGTEDHHAGVTAVCAVPMPEGGQLLATPGRDGSAVQLLDPDTGALVRTLWGHTGKVTAMCAVQLANSRVLLATAGWDGGTRLWDPSTGALIHTLGGNSIDGVAVCAVPFLDGLLVATPGPNGDVRLWNPKTGALVRTLNGESKTSRMDSMCAVQMTDMLLATSGPEGAVRLWNPSTGLVVHTLRVDPDGIKAMCAVPTTDGQLLAIGSAGWDGAVRLWNPDTRTIVRTLDGHRFGVSALCVVPTTDGALLASAGGDRTVRLWDPSTGRTKLILPIPHQPEAISAPAIGQLAIGLDVGLLRLSLDNNDLPGASRVRYLQERTPSKGRPWFAEER